MKKKYHILLVDNHPVTMTGIISELKDSSIGLDILKFGKAQNGQTALQYLNENQDTDIVILDIEMDEMDGLEVAEAIRSDHKNDQLRILIYTNEKSRLIAAKALAIGVDAYVLKESSTETLVDSIRHIVNGRFFVDPGLGKNKPMPPQKSRLTEWEKRVICEILKQKKDFEIAAALKKSTEDIENSKRRIKEKTGATNIVGIVLYAIENSICKDF